MLEWILATISIQPALTAAQALEVDALYSVALCGTRLRIQEKAKADGDAGRESSNGWRDEGNGKRSMRITSLEHLDLLMGKGGPDGLTF